MSNRLMTIGPSGTELRVKSPMWLDSFWDRVESGTWEPETLDAIYQIVSAGDRVIDVGAWIGVTALYAARLGADVVAYEPDPKAISEMQANFDLNKDLSFSIRPVALSTDGGVALLKSGALGDSMSSLVREIGAAHDSVAVECRAVRDEAAHESFAGARLIKIDVEGYEFELIPELMRILRKDGFRGDLLLSTHAYPTIEKAVRQLIGSRPAGTRSFRLRRVFAIGCLVPLLMLRRNLRLLWSVRGAASARISQNSGGRWEKFSLKHRILFIIRPRDRELWLQLRVAP